MLPVTDSFADIIDATTTFATAAANAPEPVVLCPPICTFNNSSTATEAYVANGLVLSVEIDSGAAAKLTKLEAIIGPATETVVSGGTSTDAQTGVVEDRLHAHWRLATPTRTPEEHAARFAAVRRASKHHQKPVAILADLQGPKIRTGALENGRPVRLRTVLEEPEFVSGAEVLNVGQVGGVAVEMNGNEADGARGDLGRGVLDVHGVGVVDVHEHWGHSREADRLHLLPK